MKVSLIYAGAGICGMSAAHHPENREAGWMPHGTASVAASLRAAGHLVTLLDLRHVAGVEDLRERIRSLCGDVFGVSVAPSGRQEAEAVCLLLKFYHPGKRVMVGGIHPSLFPHEYEGLPFDCIVIGEGELAAVALVAMAEPWPKVLRGQKPDLNALPWVARDLFDYERELRCGLAPGQEPPTVTMLAGRGCAYQCAFCQPAENAVFGTPHRIRSPENVIAELEMLHDRYGFRSVTFWDDTFTSDPGWVERFCDVYRFDARITALSRADILCRNEGMLKRLADVGLEWLLIGFESGSQRMLDMICKGTTVEQNIEAARLCRKYGVKVFASIMYGLPTETNGEADATKRMVDRIAPDHLIDFFYTPVPGTHLYDLCEDRGLLIHEEADRGICRTNMARRSLRGVDYDHIQTLRASG